MMKRAAVSAGDGDAAPPAKRPRDATAEAGEEDVDGPAPAAAALPLAASASAGAAPLPATSAGAARRACCVCAQAEAGRRYRCPACAAPYCSVGCYAQHKAECRPPPPPPPPSEAAVAAAAAAAAGAAAAAAAAGGEDAGFDARMQVALSDEALARMRVVAPLRAALRDSRLRALLRSIDSAAPAARARTLAAARRTWGAPLQAVFDDMLLAVGVATRRPDGSIEFTG